ncbi:hypothetical protein BDD43_3563 [Mucilaginibacter gracilis]|uniref:Uncharacterized protein n=1 Tax=Mucilaginibacter gracilis TaxID=423350 RepID=A0A495J348_9SPHI|nr:hypothetical protein [Mucilaginibacter gracilis]RKR83357.1 hypothetical protein BDD43_3563 [Mucilaginibacter gracilis]
MKTIDQLMNLDKAKIMFDLFRDEIPEFLSYTQAIADKVANDKEELLANWTNPFLSYHQWLQISEQVNSAIKKYGKNLTKSGSLFTDQLFDGYLAIFSNHCLEQYSINKAQSPKFKLAIDLFYLPVQPINNRNYSYIVLELHGVPEHAVIATDEDGNNRVFDSRADADAEASDCQEGLIVEI